MLGLSDTLKESHNRKLSTGIGQVGLEVKTIIHLLVMYWNPSISVINENPYALTAVATVGVSAMVDGSPCHKKVSTSGLIL